MSKTKWTTLYEGELRTPGRRGAARWIGRADDFVSGTDKRKTTRDGRRKVLRRFDVGATITVRAYRDGPRRGELIHQARVAQHDTGRKYLVTVEL